MANYYGIEASSSQKAFFVAASKSLLKQMKLLLADGIDINGRIEFNNEDWGEDKNTALTRATEHGSTRVVKFLLENGADTDAIGFQGLTALMKACSRGKAKGSKIAMALINAGADVHYTRVSDSMTALKFAAKSAQPQVLQAIIDKGVDIDGPQETKQTALMLAARSGNIEALKVLIANGADPSLQCKLPWANNATALGLAKLERRRNAIKFLSTL